MRTNEGIAERQIFSRVVRSSRAVRPNGAQRIISIETSKPAQAESFAFGK
ncbi:MAG: hypothetical protein J5898_02230 [Lachnospiraceae bacterium]|nr:hypothetical protein [Lachnospiraceae bacterium]